MWLVTEEDSPTNKTRGFKGHSPFIKGATAPSTTWCVARRTHLRARKTRACACTRARATHAHAGAQARSILDINAQGDTTRKKGDFFSK